MHMPELTARHKLTQPNTRPVSPESASEELKKTIESLGLRGQEINL